MASSPEEFTAELLFNGYVGSNALAALQRVGVIALLEQEPMSCEALAQASSCSEELLLSLLQTTARIGHLEERDGSWSLTALGKESGDLYGFFGWAVEGYGQLFTELGELASGELRYGKDVRRDERAVAQYSGLVDQRLMEPQLQALLAELDFRCIADLGCGSGRRLIEICRVNPNIRCIGIDISEAACRLAKENIREAGLQERITIICEDAFSSLASDNFGSLLNEVDVVSSFMMFHDLLAADQSGRELFASLRRAFPNCQRYIIADTVLMDEGAGKELPIFALGFELAHAFMNTRLYSKAHYDQVFHDAGLHCERCQPFGAPNTWIYQLRRP